MARRHARLTQDQVEKGSLAGRADPGAGVIPGSPLVKAFAHRRDDIALESDGQSAGTLTYPERRDVGLAGRLRFRNGAMTSGLAVTLASFTYGLLFALYRSRVLAF
jgi:hypothetical protein